MYLTEMYGFALLKRMIYAFSGGDLYSSIVQ